MSCTPLENMTRSYGHRHHPAIQAAIYERLSGITIERRCDIVENESPTEFESTLNDHI